MENINEQVNKNQFTKQEESFEEKNPESGKPGYADLVVSGKHGGVEFLLEVKDWPEGDREIGRIFPRLIENFIEQAGQEMFSGSKESDKESFAHYMSAKNISSWMKHLLNPELLSKCPMKLTVKDHFGNESMVEIK